MSGFRGRISLVSLALALIAVSSAYGFVIKSMDLPELCGNAEKIFRGKVLNVTESSVQVGGGELATKVVRLEVIQAFKGSYETVKGTQIVEFETITRPKNAATWPLPEVPALGVGNEYVLMVSAPSSAGLSATIGIGQGCFTLSEKDKVEMVSNGAGTSMTYAELATQINAALGQ